MQNPEVVSRPSAQKLLNFALKYCGKPVDPERGFYLFEFTGADYSMMLFSIFPAEISKNASHNCADMSLGIASPDQICWDEAAVPEQLAENISVFLDSLAHLRHTETPQGITVSLLQPRPENIQHHLRVLLFLYSLAQKFPTASDFKPDLVRRSFSLPSWGAQTAQCPLFGSFCFSTNVSPLVFNPTLPKAEAPPSSQHAAQPSALTNANNNNNKKPRVPIFVKKPISEPQPTKSKKYDAELLSPLVVVPTLKEMDRKMDSAISMFLNHVSNGTDYSTCGDVLEALNSADPIQIAKHLSSLQ